MRRFVNLLILSLALCLLHVSVSAQQQRADDGEGAKWETLEKCRLVTGADVDGDSFHVMHNQREYIFRLYFVDAPETDPSLKDRIEDQAAYFGISQDDIPRAGRLAGKFTRDKLQGQDFTILTRWQNAMGRSGLARFYGIVFLSSTNLAEELVVNGLARIYGLRANWPDGPRSTTFINKLKNLELTAREKKLGVWDESRFPHVAQTPPSEAATTNAPPASGLIDINSASYEELQKLPGIGPVLAERIILRRPYENVDDLDAVPGIGPVTIDRLRPLVRVEVTEK